MPIKFNEVTWYSKFGAVVLFLLILPVLMFYLGREYQKTRDVLENVREGMTPSVTEQTQDVSTISFAEPKNGTYIIDGQLITLKNGKNIQSVAPGSVSDQVTQIFGGEVVGDISGDGLTDSTFFISQETGGTGIFFYVAAAIQKNGAYVGTEAIFLGDRIAPQNINIMKGVAAVNFADRLVGQPMSADPSVGITKYVRADGGKLVEEQVNDTSSDPFQPKSGDKNVSNIVGYFAGGAFFWYVPNWIEQNWRIDNEGEGFVIVSKSFDDRKFSDIVLRVSTSTEKNNALYLYDTDRKSLNGRLVINEVLHNKHTEGGLTIQMDTNTQIYHVQKEQGGLILDHYYIDGSGGKTLTITFSAPTSDFTRYEKAIRGFVEGIGKGSGPQG